MEMSFLSYIVQCHLFLGKEGGISAKVCLAGTQYIIVKYEYNGVHPYFCMFVPKHPLVITVANNFNPDQV